MTTDRRAHAFRWRPPAPRVEALLVGALVVAVHLLAGIASAYAVGAATDDGVYAVLGRAIAEGQGYHSVHLVGAPVQVKYPPGFPLIVAIMWRLGGSIEGVQRIAAVVHPCLIGLSAGLLWWLGRVRLGAPRALLALLVPVPLLLEPAIQYSSIVLSEPWFILGWAGSLVLWSLADSLPAGRRRLTALSLLGLLVATTILIRAHGIVLLPALAVALWTRPFSLRERWAGLVAAMLPLAAWQLYHHILVARGPVSSLPDEGQYLDWVTGGGTAVVWALIAGAWKNAASYLSQFAPYLASHTQLGRFAAGLLFGGAGVGALVAIRRAPFLALSAVGAAALVLVWPYPQDRLLLPVLPVLGLAAAAGFAPLLSRSARLPSRLVAAGCVLAAGLILIRQVDVRRQSVSAFAEFRPSPFFSPTYVLLVGSRYITHASEWISHHTAPHDRLMVDNGAGIYLYTGRTTVAANPAESRLLPSVFAEPGRFLATRILGDSLQWLFVGVPKPGILRDIDTIKRRCPGVLTWGGTAPGDPPFVFRIAPDAACLRRIVEG